MIQSDSIEGRVANIKQQLEQYRYNQKFNFTGVVYKLASSSSLYDYALSVPANGVARVIINIEPENGDLVLSNLSAFFRIDNSNVMADATPANQPRLAPNESKLLWMYLLPLVPLNGTSRYLLVGESVSAFPRTLYIKAYVSATDDTTWSWTPA